MYQFGARHHDQQGSPCESPRISHHNTTYCRSRLRCCFQISIPRVPLVRRFACLVVVVPQCSLGSKALKRNRKGINSVLVRCRCSDYTSFALNNNRNRRETKHRKTKTVTTNNKYHYDVRADKELEQGQHQITNSNAHQRRP